MKLIKWFRDLYSFEYNDRGDRAPSFSFGTPYGVRQILESNMKSDAGDEVREVKDNPKSWVMLPTSYQPDTIESRQESGLTYVKYYHFAEIDKLRAELAERKSEHLELIDVAEKLEADLSACVSALKLIQENRAEIFIPEKFDKVDEALAKVGVK